MAYSNEIQWDLILYLTGKRTVVSTLKSEMGDEGRVSKALESEKWNLGASESLTFWENPMYFIKVHLNLC